MLSVAAGAGLGAAQALAPGLKSPNAEKVIFNLATDDLMVYSHEPGDLPAETMERVDASFLRANVQQHDSKRIDAASTVTCVGMDMVDGREWWGEATNMWNILAVMCILLDNPNTVSSCVPCFLCVAAVDRFD